MKYIVPFSTLILACACECAAAPSPRFSLTYGGKEVCSDSIAAEVLPQEGEWTRERRDLGGGLVVVTKCRRFGDAVEWVNVLENASANDTRRIAAFRDCDLLVPFAPDPVPASRAFVTEGVQTLVYSHVGSIWSENEFAAADVTAVSCENRSRQALFQGGRPMHFAPVGGRSSDGTMPYFNICRGDEGVIFAIGWSGQWTCDLSRDGAGVVRIRTGLEDCDFVLKPGERIRLSSIVVLPYKGGYFAGQNAFRRLAKAHFTPLGTDRRPKECPVSVNMWGGVTSDELVRRINFVSNQKLGFQNVWIDAGWAGRYTTPSPNEFEGAWYAEVGDWRPNDKFHPDCMTNVSAAAHANGMRFLLWFEIERAMPKSPVATAHPDWFLWNAPKPGQWSGLLDLGNEKAWQWAHDTLAEAIRSMGVDCYRQDFNMQPLPFWRFADAADGRKGMHEIRHVMGLYRLWDALLAEFPSLLIDNCASGGRRLDIELYRRSIPLWRSDYQCPANHDPDVAQGHMRNLSLWLPYHGTSIGRKIGDTYLARSCYAGSEGCNFVYSFDNAPENYSSRDLGWVRGFVAEYKKVQPYLSEDYYPLTPFATDKAAWCVMEFYAASRQEGVLLAFRRAESPFETGRFSLCGVETSCDYELTDADTGAKRTVSGASLVGKGIDLALPEPRSSRLIFFRSVRPAAK